MRTLKLIVAIVSLLLMSGMVNRALAQPAIVNDPQGNLLLAALQALQERNVGLQELVGDKVNEMAKQGMDRLSEGFIEDLKTLVQISQLLESMYCRTDELNILINLSGSNCIINMDYNIAIADLQYSMDVLKNVFVGVKLLKATAGERTQILQRILESLKESIAQMDKLRMGLSLNLKTIALQQLMEYERKTSAKYMSTSRYH